MSAYNVSGQAHNYFHGDQETRGWLSYVPSKYALMCNFGARVALRKPLLLLPCQTRADLDDMIASAVVDIRILFLDAV